MLDACVVDQPLKPLGINAEAISSRRLQRPFPLANVLGANEEIESDNVPTKAIVGAYTEGQRRPIRRVLRKRRTRPCTVGGLAMLHRGGVHRHERRHSRGRNGGCRGPAAFASVAARRRSSGSAQLDDCLALTWQDHPALAGQLARRSRQRAQAVRSGGQPHVEHALRPHSRNGRAAVVEVVVREYDVAGGVDDLARILERLGDGGVNGKALLDQQAERRLCGLLLLSA
jgi:hypothetical protein